jgi:hypothetical protein
MLQFPRPGEGLKTAVIRRFGIGRKTASRQLFALEVILKTLAAKPFSGTSLIGTGAVFQIAFFFAFHPVISFEKSEHFTAVLWPACIDKSINHLRIDLSEIKNLFFSINNDKYFLAERAAHFFHSHFLVLKSGPAGLGKSNTYPQVIHNACLRCVNIVKKKIFSLIS